MAAASFLASLNCSETRQFCRRAKCLEKSAKTVAQWWH